MNTPATPTKDQVLEALRAVSLPEGGDLVGRDLVRALVVDEGMVRFVIEAVTPDDARKLDAVRGQAERAVQAVPGVTRVSVAL
ncbi:MAG TPA: iron-sulfur cluster assembly protein, partial [Paracoccus sp.]|nr:iron-sulfur cluster assembly protein [Paracoccus sp. (in: a-proteobacteria)]